jgi:Bacterial protein of unknown function (DUF899)
MATHEVVKHDAWLAARKKHLAKEKEFTQLRDQLSRERRNLPWELVERQYTFQGERGTQTLGDLFEGRSQLVINHAMFNPDTAGPHTPWTRDSACFVCSFWMDNFNGVTIHLNHRDITMAAVSRAPYSKLAGEGLTHNVTRCADGVGKRAVRVRRDRSIPLRDEEHGFLRAERPREGPRRIPAVEQPALDLNWNDASVGERPRRSGDRLNVR